MFKVDSVGDGYPCNWLRTCDACHAAACNLYCHTDSAYLCFSCDECIHATNPQFLQHHRVLVCSECENAPAAFTCKHGCQNPDLDPTILRFYDLTYPKRFKSFKDLYDRSGSIGSYNSDDLKRHWFLLIFFNFTECSIGPK